MAGTSPTLRQREVAARLRQLRHDRGATVEQVAQALMCSPTKISRIETGARPASLRDVRDLCRIYDVPEPAATELMDLARQAREPGWWRQYDDLNIGPYFGLEQAATSITHFGMYYLHGLLQTEEYARALIKGIVPKIHPKILDERVEARMRRHQVLEQPNPPRFRELLDEAALHRQIGGPAVMHAQLAHILQLAGEGKLTVQVLPFEVGAHASDGSFTYLEFGDSSIPNMVVTEFLEINFFLERPSELQRAREALEYLRDAALSPRDSVNLITDIRNTHAE